MTPILVAVLTAVLIALALGVSRPIGRWFVRAIKATFAEVVNDAVEPRFRQLGKHLDAVQRQNTVEHGETSRRLGLVETELALLTERVAALEPTEEQ